MIQDFTWNAESQAYTSSDNGGRGCGCALWFDNLIDYKQFQSVGQDLYVRMSASKSELKDKLRMELAAVIRTLLSCAFGAVYCQLLHLQKPQKVERETKDNKENDQENQGQDEDMELPIFEPHTIARAADSFSVDIKVREGGFGTVYKGTLANGQEIAVKRLSKSSGQD
ncbi:S-locus lectin protein kinase family protein [Theobroma cacao]|uniref:S-locus lectin protein kinase family protein n=1 Tax=Theobroma cacao TaxID=3641 RepID=A0A061FE11_THECC|nr:S-locus lectin protein kinase family protein [Theobroma cacao]